MRAHPGGEGCRCGQGRQESWRWFSRRLVSDFRDAVDCSPPGSSVRGILQTRILEWVTVFFSKQSWASRES